MQDSCFYKYDLFEEKGSVKIRLYLDESSTEYTTEFGQEFGFFKKDSDESLKELALDFVEKNFPKIKAATIVIMAGAVLLSNFTMRKADASSQGFNMSYLYFGNTKSYIQEVDSTQGNLNVVSPSYFNINSDGSLNITNQFDPVFLKEMKMRGVKVVPFLSNHWDRNLGRAALQNRAQLAQQIADFVSANDLQGVQVDIENVTEIDRDNYTDLIKLLHEKLPAGKEVSVAVAANPDNWSRGWQGSYDYKELAKYADYLMIMTYDQSYQGSPEGPVAGLPWVERSIQAALKLDVPPEKIVLGIPFYGRYWKQGAATGGDGISNIRVDQMLAKYGGTVTYDTTASSPMATITIKDTDPTTVIAGKTLGPGTYHVWYENQDSIKAKLALINKYHLKGSGSWSLGQENPSIWQNYRTGITQDGSLTVIPASPGHPAERTTNVSVNAQSATAKVSMQNSAPSLQGKVMIPKTNNVEIRAGASTSYKIIKKLMKSDSVKVTREFIDKGKVKWLNVQTGKTNGWVVSSKLAPAPQVKSAAAAPKKSFVLKMGAKGSAVTALQSKLSKNRLFKGKINGTFDAATKTALITFQKKYKLKPDGIAGAATLSKLDALSANKKGGTK